MHATHELDCRFDLKDRNWNESNKNFFKKKIGNVGFYPHFFVIALVGSVVAATAAGCYSFHSLCVCMLFFYLFPHVCSLLNCLYDSRFFVSILYFSCNEQKTKYKFHKLTMYPNVIPFSYLFYVSPFW